MERLPYLLTVVLTILILMFFNSISQAQTSFNISNQTTGDTLFTIDNEGNVGIGTTTPTANLHIFGINGAFFGGISGSGTIPVEGAGTRMMWYPYKAAFRVGNVANTQWNDANIGIYSMAMGNNTMANGSYSTATGWNTIASGFASTALGRSTTASGYNATAMGINTIASAAYSTALGASTTASGNYSTSIGHGIEVSGDHSIAIALSDQSGVNVSQASTMAIMGGNLGIGTTSPAHKLEVADTIYSSFGGFKFPDNTVQETAAIGGGASSIDDLSDAITGGNSVFLGSGAGGNDDASDNRNTAVGLSALNANTTGYNNTANGFNAQYWNDVGNDNVSIGYQADYYNQGGSQNTILGFQAGAAGSPGLHNKSGNVFLGYQAGFSETGDNKLYIENSSSTIPLIGGDFSTDDIDLNGDVYIRDRLGVGTTSPGAGMHLVGSGYPNSFMFLESLTGADAGFRLYEGLTDKWHIFNNATLDGLQIYNNVGQNVFFADQSTAFVGIGTTTPLTKLHVENVDISLQAIDLPNELITVENSDAGLGLYSNNGGSYGSVFNMGEIVSGSLSNKWSIYRTTSAANPASQLRFSFGNSADYWTNPTYLALSNNGNIGIGTTDPSLNRLRVVANNDNSNAIIGVIYPTGSDNYAGTYGYASGGTGTNYGLHGYAQNGDYNFGVYGGAYNGTTDDVGVYGDAFSSSADFAGYFYGNVYTSGSSTKSIGITKIDHPLDPENKYLQHSSVESSDMMNVYNGNVILDSNGEEWVEMPDWFDALNKDFRYQLTAIGQPGPNLYISEKLKNNQFKIAGGKSGMEVSWQITGIRKDKLAEQFPIVVEKDKSAKERGKYLHPSAFGLDESRGIGFDRHKDIEEQNNTN